MRQVKEPSTPALQDGVSTSSLKEALARAEAAEARAKLLEQQADNLGRQLALLEVRSCAGGIPCYQLIAGDVAKSLPARLLPFGRGADSSLLIARGLESRSPTQ